MAREVTNKNDETDRLLDELIKGKTPEQILGEGGLLKQLTKRMVERALAAELTAHLGYDPHERAEEARDNARNGTNPKTVIGGDGAPRDRGATRPGRDLRARPRQEAPAKARGLR